MAKSKRASVIKNNNQRLKKNVFGPVEAARLERISAKLLELAAQPKPIKEVEMETVNEDEAKEATKDDSAMEVDSAKPVKVGSKKIEKKRRVKKNKIVFPKYGEKFSKKRK